jgi:hypothetical protein
MVAKILRSYANAFYMLLNWEHGSCGRAIESGQAYLTPSFCLLEAQGHVQATGSIPSTEWSKLKRNWEGITKLSPLMLR